MEFGLVLLMGAALVFTLGLAYRLFQLKNAALAKVSDVYTLLFRFHSVLLSQQPLYQDTVTNLISWSLFQDRLNINIKLSERHALLMAIMYIDLDHFKVI